MLKTHPAPTEAASITITPRESDVLTRILKGYSSPRISDELGISLHTTKTHLGHLFLKFGVENRTQLALKAAVSLYSISKQASGKAI